MKSGNRKLTNVTIYTPAVQTLCEESSLVDNTLLVCVLTLHAFMHFSTFLSFLSILLFFSVSRFIYQTYLSVIFFKNKLS